MKSIGIILAGGNNNRIGRLSDKRAIAALPVAGSYRASSGVTLAEGNKYKCYIDDIEIL